MTEFQGVLPSLSAALTKRGYTKLTSVQQAVLAPELAGQDLLVSAQTGSGKTVAFGLALAPTLLGDAQSFAKIGAPLALVIAPTRELALQVTRELEWLYGPSGGTIASCVGGMDMRAERQALSRYPHIVVGTPGRLKDHVERGSFDTSNLKAVVLDEADEMLDMGFRDELQYILETAPIERRTLLFSATVPKDIAALARQYQKDAKRISTKEEEKQHTDIEYQALNIAPSDRENAIINLLRFHDAKSAIIFCGTRVEVNHLTSRLTNRGFSVVALSGELSQGERSHALQALRDGRAKVCVATDVASRGIDLPGLALVIHADIPKNRDILLHRSGRTGRAGSKGISVLIVPHNARRRAENMLQNARVKATWGKPPGVEDILNRDKERFLANPAFSEPVTDAEKLTVDELFARYTPEQIAAVLVRQHNAQKPAPEELLDASSAPSGDRHSRGGREGFRESGRDGGRESSRDAGRENFKNSVWVSLSIGRDASAEPRWILPMLCGKGNITKNDIGAIKVHQKETHVELTADSVDRFFKAVGDGGRLEKNIVVNRMAGKPDMPKGEGYGDSNRAKGGYGERKPFHKKHGGGDKPRFGKPEGEGGAPRHHAKPEFAKSDSARSEGTEKLRLGKPDGERKPGGFGKPKFHGKSDGTGKPRFGKQDGAAKSGGDGKPKYFGKPGESRKPDGSKGHKPFFKKKFEGPKG